MAATEQPKDFSDLYTDLIQRVRSDSSVSATVTQAKRYINIGLHDMHIGASERFPWAEREAILLTHPVYQFDGTPDGGVSVSQGASFMQFTTAAGTTSLGATSTNTFGQPNMRPGGRVLVSGDSESYAIRTVTDVAGSYDLCDVDSKYVAADTTTEVAFKYYEDEYALASDFLRPLDVQVFSGGGIPVRLIGRNKFRDMYPNDTTFGKPFVGTLIDRPIGTIDTSTGNPTDTTPRRRLRLHPIPDQAYRIPYHYVTSNLAVSSTGTAQTQLVEDDDEPIVPLRYRMLVVLHALAAWYRDKHDDPARADSAMKEYEKLAMRVRADTEIGQNRPQFRPGASRYRRRARRQWSGGGTRRFDRGEFDYMGS